MAKELRGKVKEKVWIRPTCTDDSDDFRSGQAARRDFKEDCIDAHEPNDVASSDLIGEAQELGECFDDEPLDAGVSEM